MATQVQNRRGTTAEHTTFTGANGELTVDTTKRTLVVHDGATAGGRPLLREDQSNLPTSAPTTGIYNASGSLAISTNGTKRIEIQADGDIDIDNGGVFYDATNNRLAIGTTSPNQSLHVNGIIQSDSSGNYLQLQQATNDSYINNTGSGGIIFRQGAGFTERARIDSSGRLLVGTSSSRTFSGFVATRFQVEGTTYGDASLSLANNENTTDGAYILLGKSRGTSLGSTTIVSNSDLLGEVRFAGADGSALRSAAGIAAYVDATPGANDMPGRLVFSTTADGASSPTERMRIGSNGTVLIGKTTAGIGNAGIELNTLAQDAMFTNYAATPVYVNRTANDGVLIDFQQDSTTEGSISVSGTTVSYNGAHLSRWSQLPSGAERTEILRGSVLSNIDEMCEWGDEENEQLNRMMVSDVEGDKNVAGVFQAWDDDDDTYTNDFYCAMTGDFIIRIGAGVTVERGDLLMSAGDGTAKPQDDGIIRSKTIAKVTSTNVTCTYEDGSYCVPCVLMAC